MKGKPDRRIRAKRAQEYYAWANIKSRTGNPKNPSYHNYGGRGISMFEEWKNDYLSFLAYVGPKPSPKHSIDRYPDNDGNYEPGNVRWATIKEQNRWRRENRYIIIDGKTQCASAWAEEYGICPKLFRERMVAGIEPLRALTNPKKWIKG